MRSGVTGSRVKGWGTVIDSFMVLRAGFFERIAGFHPGYDPVQIGIVEFGTPLLDFQHGTMMREAG